MAHYDHRGRLIHLKTERAQRKYSDYNRSSASLDRATREENNMGKVIKSGERPEFFAKGGDTKMFGKGYASPAEDGVSGKQSQGSNVGETPDKPYEHESYTDGMKYLEGGNNKMFGPGSAGKKVPGISGKETQVG